MRKIVLTEDVVVKNKLLSYFDVITNINDLPINQTIVIMISYGKLIQQEVLEKHIFLNVHNSLLPKYRGLHAFTWAIINGEKETGYTLHKVEQGIDNGGIISQVKIIINEIDDINSIFCKANDILYNWIIREIDILDVDRINNATLQNNEDATYVCKRKQEDSLIDWNNTDIHIHNLVRAVAPPYTNGAFTFWKGKPLYIKKTELLNSNNYIANNGQIVAKIQNKGVLVKCNNKPLLVSEVIYEGKSISPFYLFKTVGGKLKDS